MTAVTDQFERQMKAGRRVMDRSFHVVESQVKPAMAMRRVQVASGAMIAIVVAIAAGILVYRRLRRRSLASRIQSVLPDQIVQRADAIKRALG